MGEDYIQYADNPMHATTGMEARPMREWLANHLPSVDAPSIFAVHQAFENDGIKTFNYLVECIKGKVTDISEIKNYTRAGKLSKMDALAIIKAIEEATSVSATGSGTSLSTPAAVQGAAMQAVLGNISPAASNSMRTDSTLIVEAMNAQTQAISRVIIEAQQKASHDMAANIAKLMTEDKKVESL